MHELSYPTHAQHLVLVASSDQASQRSLSRTLRRRGYDVIVVGSVAAACEQLDRLDVDVVLTDAALVDDRGEGVTDAARRRDPELPVVVLARTPSAPAPGGTPTVCLALPVEEADLLDAIASVRRRDQDPLVAESTAFDDALRGMYVAVQPVIRWSQQDVVACEVLLRSQHRLLGRPERLIAAAVRHGRMHDLGAAIHTQIAACIDELPAGDVYVNLHPAELEDDALLATDSPLARHAHRVILDVSAQAGLDRVGAAARVASLRELGFRIALDDVSEGGGLGLLAILRPDVLKIDGSLVHGIRRDPLRRALVRGLVDLGARLGAGVIAEGVETEDDLIGAVECGADQCSGFLFGRPASRLPALDLRAIRHRVTP